MKSLNESGKQNSRAEHPMDVDHRNRGGSMDKRLLRLGVLALAALGGMAFSFGGWAVVTVDDLPQSFTVGQPTTFAFAARPGGLTVSHFTSPLGSDMSAMRVFAAGASPTFGRPLISST